MLCRQHLHGARLGILSWAGGAGGRIGGQAGLLGLLAIVAADAARGEGFRNPPAGAFGLGRAGGRIAHVEDASAVAHNPANLTRLQGPEAQASLMLVHLVADYRSPAGATARTRDPWKILPCTFAAVPFAQGRWGLGFGVTVPFGLSILYPPDAAFRYTAPYHNDLKVINFNPTVFARLHDRLSVGAGVDVFYSRLSLRQIYPWLAFPGGGLGDPDGEMSLKGSGAGVGGNLGLTWEPVDGHRLAFTLRSPVEVNYEGDFHVSGLSAAGLAAGATPRSEMKTRIAFPTILGVGYGVELSKKLRFEVGFEWIQFSRFHSLALNPGNNAVLFTGLGASPVIPQNWRDTWTLGLAGDWKLGRDWTLLFGYQHYQSPVPDRTFSPSIPDANQNALTGGLAWRRGRHDLKVSYGAVLYDTRRLNNNLNPAFNGRWGMMVHLISAAYACRF